MIPRMQSLWRPRVAALAAALIGLAGWMAGSAVTPAGSAEPDARKKADKLFEDKNYRDAAAAYEEFLKGNPSDDDAWHSSSQIILCHLRMQAFDKAEAAGEEAVKRLAGKIGEARAHRLIGNLYLALPHYGSEQAGKFHRAKWDGNGRYVQTNIRDRDRAVSHLEKARELYAKFAADPAALSEKDRKEIREERIEAIFDLTAAVTRFSPYDLQWWDWGGEEAEEDDGTVGESETAEGRGFRGRRFGGMPRIKGLPMGADGKPVFEPVPTEYSGKLSTTQKMKFLLAEAGRLDHTDKHVYAAKALYRRAMLARSRYGTERLQNVMWYDFGAGRLSDQFAKKKVWDLADNQVLTLVGSRLTEVGLPADEDILALLDMVAKEYPESGIADEAIYARGLYFQGRKQFTRAVAEYERLARAFPGSKYARAAESNTAQIRRADAAVGQTGVQLPDAPAKLTVTHRNTDKVEFTAWKLDLDKMIEDSKKELEGDPARWQGHLQNLHWSILHDDRGRRYRGAEVASWTAAVPDDKTHRTAVTEVATPIKDAGCYWIEGRVAGGPTFHNVLLINGLALVEKSANGKKIYWTVDARTGRPVECRLDFFEYASRWDQKERRQHWMTHRFQDKTNDAGLFEYTPRGPNKQCQVVVTATAADGRTAFSGVQWWNAHWHREQDFTGWRAYGASDRPVYRPGQDVNFKMWVRGLRNGEYQDAAGARVQVIITDPKGNKVFDKTLAADDHGGVSDKITLTASAPLGMYHTQVLVNRQWAQLGGGNFRVEEYKKPEFEVTVDAAKSRAKLGEKIDVRIAARYYFGAPVTEATVKYKVFRTPYEHMYTSAGDWDWLYGIGYGRCWYRYDWFPGWGRWSAPCCVWYPWWGAPPQPEKELVAEGEAPIGHDGTLAVTVDTAKAAREHGDSDHRYTVEAEVRDASRRTITGGGSVTATRQEFYAFVEANRGWYAPGDQVFFKVRTLTADNTPRPVRGKVTVARVSYVGENGDRLTEEPVQSWEAETDADGKLDFSIRAEKSGQFKVSFEAKDAWGGQVAGAGVVWVAGADFDGRLYRFTDLEIIADKRTYKVGDTARLMINAKHAGSAVLFAGNAVNGVMLEHKLLFLPNKSKVVEVPITKAGMPNFFVEATLVRDGRIHSEAREICVPPEQGMVNVTVKTDKAEYRPGQKGTIEVTTTDPDGRPVAAQVALTAFDKSVLYIQGELSPDIRQFFWGQKRQHHVSAGSNLNLHFGGTHHVHEPQHWHAATPDAWYGSWGNRWANFAEMERNELAGFAGGRGGAVAKSAAAPGAAPPAEAAGEAQADAAGPAQNGARDRALRSDVKAKQDGLPADAGGQPFAEATVRSKFADTALWLPALTTGADGKATAEITFPENLTGWRIKAYGMTKGTRVGSAAAEAVTTKNLLVRLQAPRFFVERDEVVLSANVHNYLKTEKTARVSIKTDPHLMALQGPATVDVKIPAGGEKRVDWVVKVLNEGKAAVRMTALTDEESDAMEVTFPVLVHGIDKMVAAVGSIRPADAGAKTLALVVPEERKPSATKLEVRFSPSLAGAMIDALPYLVSYPYGCTEQTMSRFLPTVVTAKTLQQMGVRLEDVAKQAVNLNAQEIGKPRPERFKSYYAKSPVFDTAEMNKMIAAGLDRLYGFQNGNGGWGWWRDDNPNPYLTAYVLYGLITAAECDVPVRQDVLARGFNALKVGVDHELGLIKAKKHSVNDTLAFAAFVMSMKKEKNAELLQLLFEKRDALAVYGKALLCLTHHKLGDADKAKLLLQNIMQYREEDKENETVWFRTPQAGWWWWYNNDIETNAFVLKVLAAMDPKHPDAPGVVKWLLNNRRHGTYWRSTRDTAICVQAMGEYIRASGEAEPDYVLTVHLDGKPVKSVRITKENFFTFDNALTLEGEALAGGKHELSISREGKGAVYYSAYLSYFTKEADIKAAGLELKVDRRYYRLDRVDAEKNVEGANGQAVVEKRLRWKRTELKNGDLVASGDLIEVELKLTAKNDYDYLCFEDYKPAGCEPVEVRSGGRYGDLCSNMELRDDRTVFFVSWLSQGEHMVKYRLRAEIPGVFHALPTKGHAMYAPELSCNSDEMLLKIKDK